MAFNADQERVKKYSAKAEVQNEKCRQIYFLRILETDQEFNFCQSFALIQIEFRIQNSAVRIYLTVITSVIC